MTNSAQPPKEPKNSATEQEKIVPQITEKQARRINAPARNMVISMLVMIALLLPILLLVPQLTSTKNHYSPNVDIASIAYLAGQEAGYPVSSPTPEGWTYNFARWNSGQADGISYWNTGLVSPNQQYVELLQAKDTNATWVASKTNNAAVSGEIEIKNTTWQIRVYTDKDGSSTTCYTSEVSGATVILCADDATETATLEELAGYVIDYAAHPTHTVEPSPTGTSGIQ